MRLLFHLKLYTTSCCHLCEEADRLLTQLTLNNQCTLIDIADDDELLSHYETRIPVLQRSDNQAELDWPFSKKEVIAFIK